MGKDCACGFDCSTLKPGDICLDRGNKEWEFVKCIPTTEYGKPYLFCNPKGETNWARENGMVHSPHHSPDYSTYDIVKKKPNIVKVEGWINYYPFHKSWGQNVYETCAEAKNGTDPGNSVQCKVVAEYEQ